MNIHEYQAKELLRGYKIPVPRGEVIHKAEDAERAAWEIESNVAVVKAQIHAGAIISGGKGTAVEKVETMKNCGIHIAENPAVIGEVLVKVLKNNNLWRSEYED
ncbi:ATP-grasp domain-containing protein [Brassicibacter mesophilus]|uniref:ATP-grasp domain-containing protein n=1 Tax=Brassicibacter mesophilus TaxID=745119 RepID=UPI003D196109